MPDQGGYDPNPLVGVYHSPFYHSAMTTSCVLNYLASGNAVEKKDSVICGQIFINQITGDMCKHDYDNKLFITLNERMSGLATELQKFLHDKNVQWHKITILLILFSTKNEEPVTISIMIIIRKEVSASS